MHIVDIGAVPDSLAGMIEQVHAKKTPITIERQGESLAAVVSMEDLELRKSLTAETPSEYRENPRTMVLFEETESLARLGHWERDEIEDKATYCSRGLARLHGCTVEDYLHRSNSNEADFLWIHADDRDRYAQASFKLKSDGVGFNMDFRLLREAGKKFADQALRLSERRYRELFEESPMPMLEENW